MAQSTGFGFHYRRNLRPGQKPAVLEVTLTDSANVAIGEAVYWNVGYLSPAPADQAILGILTGIVTSKGENVFKTNEVHGGAISGDDTYTASATNESVEGVKGVVIVDKDALFQTTNDEALTQAQVGLWFLGLVNTNTGMDGISGSGLTPAAWAVGTQDFQLVELITENLDGSTTTTQGLFKMGRSQLLNDVTI
jgi:hypothetical protein